MSLFVFAKNIIPYRQDWSQIRAQLEIYFEERLCDRNI